MKIYIYELVDPDTYLPRYIGKTVNVKSGIVLKKLLRQ